MSKPTSTFPLIRLLFLFLVLGIVFTGLLRFSKRAGLVERWQLITQVPENVVEVVGGSPGCCGYLRSAQGQVYECGGKAPYMGCVPGIIPEFLDSYGHQACDDALVAFSPLASPPQGIISCVYVKRLNFVLAVDGDRNLWQWFVPPSRSNLFDEPLYILLGGFTVTILGSILWALARILRRDFEADEILFTKAHLVILILPILCLLCTATTRALYSSALPFSPSNPQMQAVYARSTQVSIAFATQEGQKWVVDEQPTPNPENPRFDFVKNMCSARWTVGEDNSGLGRQPLQCQSDVDIFNSSLAKILVPSKGDPSVEEAIGLRVSRQGLAVSGDFPAIEIAAGDHFKAGIGSLEQPFAYNLIFEVFYEIQGEKRVYLGRWAQTQDGQMEEIDLDLSSLAGKKVRMILQVYAPDGRIEVQYPFWFKPRIEK